MFRIIYETDNEVRERLNSLSEEKLRFLEESYIDIMKPLRNPFNWPGYITRRYRLWKSGYLNNSIRSLVLPKRREYEIAKELLAYIERQKPIKDRLKLIKI